MEKGKTASVKNTFTAIITVQLIFIMIVLVCIYGIKRFDKKSYKKIASTVKQYISVDTTADDFFKEFYK